MNRREALRRVACGFGHLALAGMLGSRLTHARSTSTAPLSHFAPRAKRVVFIFMQGGPSHVDTFDYKPILEQRDGEMRDFADARTIAKTGQRASQQRIFKSPWKFSRHGQCGQWVSDLFPEMAKRVDDLCFIHSLQTEGVAHGPATLFLHTGATNFIRPSIGSWINYGLGSENDNLPAFLTISPSAGNGGARNYGSAFLPSTFQGTAIGRAGAPASDAKIRNLVTSLRSPAEQKQQFDLIRGLNAQQAKVHPGDQELDAMINSFELAWRMQSEAPDILDLSKERPATLSMYGINEKPTDNFGRQLLMARRLCESGVRYIQVTYGDNTANPAWDQHSNLPKHAEHARAIDKPVAGFIADLKQRGLLEDTVVWWGGEFGRTPYAEKNGTGRDHNPGGFTVWLAGAGVKPGFALGATDEFGHMAVQDRVHMHDLHATILHLLGLDHEELTYRYDGRDFRLTDVHGHIIRDIIS